MRKYLLVLATGAILFTPLATSATLLGHTGQACSISDTDRGGSIVQAVTLADAEAINNLYSQYWGRGAKCDELQNHIDWGTPLGRLAEWLNGSPHSVPVIGSECSYPTGTTKDAVDNINNIYLDEAGRNMNCSEALFHLNTDHTVLRNWLVNDATFNQDYQAWKQSFQLIGGATYRDESKFWLIQNGQRRWVPDVPTMFAWGLIFDDSIHIPKNEEKEGFYNMVPEGEPLNFWDGVYKTPVQNRYRGSGYGEMPDSLEEAIQSHRDLEGSTWRGYAEFRGSYCSQAAYCDL